MKWRRDKRQPRRPWMAWAMLAATILWITPFVGGGCSDDSYQSSHSSASSSSSASSGEGGFGGSGISSSSSSSSGISSSSSSSSSSGQGGSGGGGPCLGDADCVNFQNCPAQPEFFCVCTRVVCDSGSCIPADFLATGTPAKFQTDGDCRKMICDGKGSFTIADDPTDVPGDNDDCTDDICSNGKPAYPLSAEGTPCSMGLCNGQGSCIQCVDTTQCSSGKICVGSICISPTCINGIQDLDESDVDCGLSCSPCISGRHCTTNDDCKSHICFQNVCN